MAYLCRSPGRSSAADLSAPPSQPRSNKLAVGVDVGGTKVAAGVVTADGEVLESLRRPTPTADPKSVEDAIVAMVEALASRHPISAVGVGAAGFLDATRSVVLFSPHLAWRNEELGQRLQARLQHPVTVDNDANAAAWAEWRFGAARGEPVVLCVNLGTGIGGAVVSEGKLWHGGFGMAGEFGHMTVVPDGHRCECGNRGCWEQYASGNALVREARELAVANSPLAQDFLGLAGGDVEAITGRLVTRAAADAHPAAMGLLEEVGRWLGAGLATLAAAFDPTMFVIGGGLSEAGDVLLEPARRSFGRNLTGRGFRPLARIVHADLGNDAGFVGAADLARAALNDTSA